MILQVPKQIAYLPIIASMLIIASCSSDKTDDSKAPAAKTPPPPSMVDAYVVVPQVLSQDIEMPGSLIPFEETELHPEISGRVTAINFKEGATAAQGSVLLKLYDGDQQAQLQKLKVQLKVAEQTTERYASLLKINGVSQQEYDLTELSVNNIKADINIIQTNIAKTQLRAPFSGKIGLRSISVGAYVTPQTVIGTLRKLSQLKLAFTVPEKYGTKMQAGSLVHFTLENNQTSYTAKIIATENNISEDTRSLMVKAVVEKGDALLIAGAFTKVQIPLGKNDAALMIPSQAIIPKARNKEVIVFRNGIAANQVVTTGTRDSANIEIVTGLKAGDTVLISGLLTVKPGTKVQLNKIVKP
jgi:membrane fusion protein (multidrug efflux system)